MHIKKYFRHIFSIAALITVPVNLSPALNPRYHGSTIREWSQNPGCRLQLSSVRSTS
ncbi:MAG: hypothetical protein PHV82_06930 [Victivallaceae bacterium]|nr:hypothetical protein [Victivallaceae bacterium]